VTAARPRGVAIIGPAPDPQAARVAAALEALDTPVQWVDATAFPDSLHMTLVPDGWRLGDEFLPTPRAAYVRAVGGNPLHPRFEADLKERPRGLVAQCAEKRAFVRGWLATLASAGCVLVNTPEANDQHAEKPRQLGLLAARGLPVPPWMATNDPGAVREFAGTHPLVFKPLAGGAEVSLLTPEDLTDERLDALALAPVLFQRYIEGVALRVYVIGGAVIAAVAIYSDAIDYRGNEAGVEPVELTAAESAVAIEAAAACGMPFAGVDLIREPGGASWLLECNPSPMFAAIEASTGVSIAGPLAAFLAGC
jgi:glutathione synthase/RimK-type ligase-like ATP-grasp enzyme